MVSLVFLIAYATYVILMSLWVESLILIPIWIISGYVFAILCTILFLYLNFIWMAYTSTMHKMKTYIARSIAIWLARYVIRVKLTYEGLEHIPLDGKITTFANHKSQIDPMAILAVMPRPTSFTPKSSVLKFPFLGKFLKYTGAMPIDRSSTRNTAKSMVNAVKLARKGMNFIVFPEGGIKSRITDQMVDMRPGAYKIALKAETDLLLISIKHMREVKYMWPWKRTHVHVIVHPVVKFESIKDMNSTEVAHKVYQIINQPL